jgi:hypothetical protein
MTLLRMLHRDHPRGQASVEFAGVLVWLLLAALLIWQLLLVHVDLQPGLQRGAHRQSRRRPRRQRHEGRQGRASRRACATDSEVTMGRREGDRNGAQPDRDPRA